jgi:hypothetical protein
MDLVPLQVEDDDEQSGSDTEGSASGENLGTLYCIVVLQILRCHEF